VKLRGSSIPLLRAEVRQIVDTCASAPNPYVNLNLQHAASQLPHLYLLCLRRLPPCNLSWSSSKTPSQTRLPSNSSQRGLRSPNRYLPHPRSLSHPPLVRSFVPCPFQVPTISTSKQAPTTCTSNSYPRDLGYRRCLPSCYRRCLGGNRGKC